MSKRKGILESARTWSASAENRDLITEHKLIEDTLNRLTDYYDIYDLDHGTNLSAAFKLLYRSKEKLSFDDAAENTFTDISTIKRYVRKFNGLALKLIKRESEKRPESTFLLRLNRV